MIRDFFKTRDVLKWKGEKGKGQPGSSNKNSMHDVKI